ncbi:MAG: IPT/TIG domain-containing protein [Candidatus Omnitrophica bacterium]|nr:IPT/TIG domain-containing protein [Candidatus Omnitrophota bacterium]
MIEEISPLSGPIGTTIVIYGSNFAPADNDVAFTHPEINFQGRNTAYLNHVPSSDGNTLSFSLPDALGACAYSRLSDEACPEIGIVLPQGAVQLSVVNATGVSNSAMFTVEE